jgi:uncharacterized protein YktA (UPF0223 family)
MTYVYFLFLFDGKTYKCEARSFAEAVELAYESGIDTTRLIGGERIATVKTKGN